MEERPLPSGTNRVPMTPSEEGSRWFLPLATLQAILLLALVVGTALFVAELRRLSNRAETLAHEVTLLQQRADAAERRLSDLEEQNAQLAAQVASRTSSTATPQPPPPVRAPDLTKLAGVPRQGRVLGDPTAPVLVVVWGDYQCPACAAFEQQLFPQLLERYVANGRVRWEFRDLAFIGRESLRAAEAASCAEEQGKFWEYHVGLYANFVGANRGGYSDARLKELASLLGLDVTAFETCLAGGRYTVRVQEAVQQALDAGVQATPSFSVNGSPPFTISRLDDLVARIEEASG